MIAEELAKRCRNLVKLDLLVYHKVGSRGLSTLGRERGVSCYSSCSPSMLA
jgi:hypothetical protein